MRKVQSSTSYIHSVRGGIHGSTEYGKLSMRAQSPRIAECRVRSEPAYVGSDFAGSLVFLISETKRFCNAH